MLALSLLCAVAVQAQVIYDKARDRAIPLEITYPVEQENCTIERKCKVAFLSAGYGISLTKYSFLVTQLNALGYMVVAILHELPQDGRVSAVLVLYQLYRSQK
jgi:predicted dienelactone hydrolase